MADGRKSCWSLQSMYSRYISFASVGSELIDINEFQKAHYTCYLFLVPDVAFKQSTNCCMCRLDVCSSASNLSSFWLNVQHLLQCVMIDVQYTVIIGRLLLSHYHTGIFQGASDDRADHKASLYLETYKVHCAEHLPSRSAEFHSLYFFALS